MRRNDAELVNQGLETVGIERRLEQEDHEIQPNQKAVDVRSRVARLVVSKGNHGGGGSLVVVIRDWSARYLILNYKLTQLLKYQIPMDGVLIIDKPAGLTSHD